MENLVKNQILELKHEPHKGAWTYHIQIPNTKHLVGKWGSLKVSGFIDDYKIENINLFTISGQDKLISVNEKIRKAIEKNGGDTVRVTLDLLAPKKQLTEKELIETLNDSGVLKAFKSLSADEQKHVITKIISIKSDDKQTKTILQLIEQLSEAPN